MKKSNKNRRFKVERKGYSIRDVEDYIALEIERNEIIYNEQRERIDSLLNENQQLKKTVEEYKSREDKIADAIILEKDLVEKYGGVTAEGIVESALDKVRIIEELGYDNLVISIKMVMFN